MDAVLARAPTEQSSLTPHHHGVVTNHTTRAAEVRRLRKGKDVEQDGKVCTN